MLAICTNCSSAQNILTTDDPCWFCGRLMTDSIRDYSHSR